MLPIDLWFVLVFSGIIVSVRGAVSAEGLFFFR